MKQKILIVVDMQNDFVGGVLGTDEAKKILSAVCEEIISAEKSGKKIFFTRDTHSADYLHTREGENLPVEHCIQYSEGWNLVSEIVDLVKNPSQIIDKETFGSRKLGEMLAEENRCMPIEEIELIGVCTDICVISNALLLKAFLPETRICVNSSCCAGSSPEHHDLALDAMKLCQIDIIE